MFRKRNGLLLLALFICSGCEKKTSPLADEKVEQFAQVYAGYLSLCASDSAREGERANFLQIQLEKHNLSRADFDQMRSQLEADPQAYIKVLERTEALLQKPPEKSALPPPAAQEGQSAIPRTL